MILRSNKKSSELRGECSLSGGVQRSLEQEGVLKSELSSALPSTLPVAVPVGRGLASAPGPPPAPTLRLSSTLSFPSACTTLWCLSHREYCQRVLRKAVQDCSQYTLSFDTTVFIIESTRRRVAVEAALENRGENAYSTVLNISQSANLQFASLIQKVGPQPPPSLRWRTPPIEPAYTSPPGSPRAHLTPTRTRISHSPL